MKKLNEAEEDESTPEFPDSSIAEASQPSRPPNDRITMLAYTLWEERGCPEGCPDQDWFEAERRLSGGSLI
jgi:hypothetical protein